MPEPTRPWRMYRWFDDNDLLIYLGISVNTDQRERDHLKSWWRSLATRVVVDPLPIAETQSQALMVERQAIRTEMPLCNLTENPGARARQERHLLARGLCLEDFAPWAPKTLMARREAERLETPTLRMVRFFRSRPDARWYDYNGDELMMNLRPTKAYLDQLEAKEMARHGQAKL